MGCNGRGSAWYGWCIVVVVVVMLGAPALAYPFPYFSSYNGPSTFGFRSSSASSYDPAYDPSLAASFSSPSSSSVNSPSSSGFSSPSSSSVTSPSSSGFSSPSSSGSPSSGFSSPSSGSSSSSSPFSSSSSTPSSSSSSPSAPQTRTPSTAPSSNSNNQQPQIMNGQKVWCIAKPASDEMTLMRNIAYACGEGGLDCTDIQPQGACYQPNTLISHASYVMNMFYQQNQRNWWTCHFNSTGLVVFADPSFGNCKYAPQ